MVDRESYATAIAAYFVAANKKRESFLSQCSEFIFIDFFFYRQQQLGDNPQSAEELYDDLRNANLTFYKQSKYLIREIGRWLVK